MTLWKIHISKSGSPFPYPFIYIYYCITLHSQWKNQRSLGINLAPSQQFAPSNILHIYSNTTYSAFITEFFCFIESRAV
jgi:phage terminase large subunit-like protein